MTDWKRALRAIAPRADPRIAAMIADHADAQFAKWKISTVRRQACIIAHAYVETQGLTRLDENLNYSAERLTQVWRKRFPTIASAQPYAHNPRALANKVYGSRMGNRPGTDDGWNNRGKGLLHCTGHDNCEALGKKLRVSTAQASAWLIDPDHALECACALFWILGVAPSADSGNVTAQTHRVNGGENGLDERKKIYPKVMRVLNAEAKSAYADQLKEKRDAGDAHAALTAADLRAAGSRTMDGAAIAKTGGVAAVGLEALSGGADYLSKASDAADTASNIAANVQNVHDAAGAAGQSATGVLAWLHAHPGVLFGIELAITIGALAAIAYALYGVSKIIRAKVDDTNDLLAALPEEPFEDDDESGEGGGAGDVAVDVEQAVEEPNYVNEQPTDGREPA